MRIAALYIEKFAELERVALTFEGTMTVIYGPNEAGKSTLLRFIRAVLFGFPPRQGSAAELSAAETGAQGGHLDVEADDGCRFRIARREAASGRSRTGQTLAVTREDGTTGGEALLRELLGGLSGELFRSLFAFGLDELQELRTLQSDELGSYLYGAGFGGQGAAIVAAERKLAAEMDQLYRPRGKLQPVGKLLAAMAEAEAELRRSKEQIGRYEALLAERDAADAAIAAAGQRLQRANADAALLGACLQAQGSWLRLRETAAELAQLPASGPMPTDALVRFERLAADREAALQAALRLQLRRDQLAAEQERLPSREVAESAIERERLADLMERLPLYRRAQLELAELAAAIEAAERELGQRLRRIGSGWDAETLAAQPAMADRAERVRSFGERFARCSREQELREHEASQQERQLAAARGRLAERERALAASLSASPAGSAAAAQRELAQLPEAMQALRSGAAQLARQRLELRHAAERERDERSRAVAEPPQRQPAEPAAAGRLWPVLAAAGAAVAAAATALALAPGQGAAAIAAAAFAAIAGWAIAAAVRRSRRAKAARSGARGRRGVRFESDAVEAAPRLDILAQEKERLEQAIRRTVISLNEQVDALRRSAGLDPAGASDASSGAFRAALAPFVESSAAAREQEDDGELPPAVRRVLAAAEQRHAALADWLSRHKRLAEQVDDAQAAVQEQEARAAASRTDAARAKEQRLRLEASWREWLEEQRLPMAEHPETTLETLRSIEAAYALLQALRQQQSKRIKLKQDAEAFEQAAEQWLGADARQDPGAALKQRQEEAERAAADTRRREALAEQLLRLDEEQQLAAAGLARVEARIDALWGEAGATDEEQFRRLVHDADRSASLRAEAAQLEALLDAALGRGDDRREAEALLAGGDAPELRRQREAALEAAERAERELAAQHDRRGRLRSELEQLERGDSHDRQLAKLEAHKAQLAELLERWAGLAIAAGLFRKTRELYERDRQPAVLQLASAYFAGITRGKYTRIMAPLGVRKLFVRREADGRQIDSALLSRGTAEQLYLAMRLSLAEHFARSVRLPIVMDDIFVNFDAVRLRQTLPVLGRVAERHQLLLFTCHTHIAEAVAAVHPGAQIAPLQSAAQYE